jgi:hypothetical protein
LVFRVKEFAEAPPGRGPGGSRKASRHSQTQLDPRSIQGPRTFFAVIHARRFAVKTSIRILQEAAEVAESTSCLSAFVVNQLRAHSRNFAVNQTPDQVNHR